MFIWNSGTTITRNNCNKALCALDIIAILYVGTWDLFKMTILTFTSTFNNFLKFLFTCVDLFSSHLTLIHNGWSKFYFILSWGTHLFFHYFKRIVYSFCINLGHCYYCVQSHCFVYFWEWQTWWILWDDKKYFHHFNMESFISVKLVGQYQRC